MTEPRRLVPWSLQRRLVVGILALLAVMGIAIGATSVLALHQNLMTRLDAQVTSALALSAREPLDAPTDPSGPGRRPASIYYSRSDLDGIIQARYTDQNGQSIALMTAQVRLLDGVSASSERPVTVDLGGRLGRFRVATTSGPLSSGGTGMLVVGQSLAELDTTTTNLVLILVLVTLVALAAAGIATAVIVRVALRPLGRVADIATRVSEIPLDKGEVALAERVPEDETDPRTEVGRVGAAFNRMLGHVEDALVAREQSENKVRQFVADASHELRTPLASIRGYSELTRRGGHELPEDVVRSLGRIESESVRMTALVEDLLLLARLDAGRELVLGDVDLVPIVIDAVRDAHAAGPDHEWRVQAPEDPVVVLGDGGRLHQVVANLLANARTHTPAGTVVGVTLAAGGGDAVLTIADDGPGIPEDLQPVLFERFARGDVSRSRTSGSTGLGLAIVAAVVESHGGSVAVASRPGDTRFTVRLPLRPR